MTETSRRSIVKGFFGLPVFAFLGGRQSSASIGVGTGDKRSQGLSILRLINTAERGHLGATGSYVAPSRLRSHYIVADWLEKPRNSAKLALYNSLDFGAGRLKGGWEHEFRLNHDGSRYTLLLRNVEYDGTASFATDEKGVIYEGDLKAAVLSANEWAAAEAVIVGSPLGRGGRRAQASGGFLAALSASLVTPVHAAEDCKEECCPFGHCSQTLPPPESGICPENCGCIDCAWCLYGC